MKGAIRTLSVLAMIPDLFRGTKIDSKTGEKVPIKPRFIPGDKFYNFLSYKKVKGKTVVKK